MRNRSALLLFLMVCPVLTEARPLTSLAQSRAFADKAEWLNENQSEGVNGSFEWYESFKAGPLRPVAKRLLAKCRPSSVSRAVAYVRGLMDQVTDSSDEAAVKQSEEAVRDFRAVLLHGAARARVQECRLEHKFTDDVGNHVTETLTGFRNPTARYEIVFRFTAD